MMTNLCDKKFKYSLKLNLKYQLVLKNHWIVHGNRQTKEEDLKSTKGNLQRL